MLLESKDGAADQFNKKQLKQFAKELSNNELKKLVEEQKMIQLLLLMSCHSEHGAKIFIKNKIANHVIYVLGDHEILNNGAKLFSYSVNSYPKSKL